MQSHLSKVSQPTIIWLIDASNNEICELVDGTCYIGYMIYKQALTSLNLSILAKINIRINKTCKILNLTLTVNNFSALNRKQLVKTCEFDKGEHC